MNEFNSFSLSALNEASGIIGDIISYKSTEYICIVSDITITEELLDGGLFQKRGIKIILSKDENINPAVGEKIIYIGKAYRILEVSKDLISWELTADTDSK